MNPDTPLAPPPGASTGAAPGTTPQLQQQQQQQPQQQPQQPVHQHRSEQDFLNAYIYDYLMKHNLHQSARVFGQEADVKVHTVMKGATIGQPGAARFMGQNHRHDIDSSEIMGDVKSEKARANGDISIPNASSNGPGKNGANDHDTKPPNANNVLSNTNTGNGLDDPASGATGNSNTLSKSVGIIDAPEGFLFEWWLIFWDLLFARSNKPASIPAQQYIHAQRIRQEQAARAAQLQQQHAAGSAAIGPQSQIINPATAMAGYPNNASLINARLNGIGHLPEGMSDLEKQRQQQLARQAALTRRAAAGGLTAAQIQTMKQQQQQQQQQQMYAQQQHMQQAALQAGQGPQPGQPTESGVDGRSEHSPPPPQSGSPSKRQRLSPDGAYSQVAPNRFVNAAGQQANAQAAHQMLLNTGMNPGQMNQQFNAQMMQLKQQQAAAQQQQAQHLQQQAHQQGHLQQQPGLSQAAMQAQQLQQYSSNLMNNHRALLNMSKGQGGAGPGLQPGAPHIPGGSPMIAHSSSDQGHPAMYVADAYGQNPAAGQLRIPPGTQQSVGGNTNALQDYQMQLMLLEQQNKRRLMVARQEQQDAVVKQPPSGAPPGQQSGQPGQGQQPGESITPFPAMSPQQGRLAPSPQPTMDMAKRATPKIANQVVPGSPLPDGQQHPAGQGQQPNSRNASPNMAGGFSGMDQFNVLVGGPGGNNLIMRGVQPSHPSGFNAPHLQQLSADQGGPRPQGMPGRQQSNANLIWTQQQGSSQQMMPGQNQPGPQQGGQQSASGQHANSQRGHTPQPQSRQQQQQHQQMPPPQAPSSAPRASASPSMASTPITAPTPPAAKILPKGKKEPREPKKRTKKQQAAAAAAAAAAGNQPVTPSATPGPTSEPPTPTTPITPQHPNSFSNGNAGSAGSSMSGGANPLLLKATTFSASQNVANNTSNSAQATSSTPSASSAPAPQTSEAPSSFLDADAPSLFPEFGTGADGDIGDLEFDINTFLNTDDATAGGLNFDPTSAFTWNESVEATGDV